MNLGIAAGRCLSRAMHCVSNNSSIAGWLVGLAFGFSLAQLALYGWSLTQAESSFIEMRKSAQLNDSKSIASHVDYTRLRESANTFFLNLHRDAQTANEFATEFSTPKGVMVLVSGGTPNGGSKSTITSKDLSFLVVRRGWNQAYVIVRMQEGNLMPFALVLERKDLTTFRLVGLSLRIPNDH